MNATAIPLNITELMRTAIASAYAQRLFVQVAYVGTDGYPHVSSRGSVVVLDHQRLGMWARKRDSGLAVAIVNAPRLTLVHSDLGETGVIYNFYGQAHTQSGGALVERVWNDMHDNERANDPERNGIAVVVDIAADHRNLPRDDH